MPILAAAAMATGGGGDHAATTVVALILGFLGIGTVALLVSNQAKTGSILTTGGTSIAHLICVALSPVTGGTCGGGTATQVTSGVNFGCTTVGGVQYCP